MGDSSNDGSHDEDASNGVASSVADDVSKQDEDVSNSMSSSGQTGVSDGVATASRDRETDGENYGEVESDEATPYAAGVADVSDEVAVGEAEQIVPTPIVDVGSQQSIQPILPAEQVGPLELLTSAEPAIFEDTITPQDLTYYDYPVYYEEPTYYDYSDYYYDPVYYDYSDYYYEEQMLEGWYPSGNYYSVAVATASVQAGGGATAYAAVGGGATAYAAAGGGVGAYAAVSTG